jgi:hypothetical protein
MKIPRLVGDYPKQYPTWGDLAREQVRRRGYVYFADVRSEILAQLTTMAPERRKLFALVCAERVMRWHERLPATEQRVYSLGWRPVLNQIWKSLSGSDAAAPHLIQAELDAFYRSPYFPSEGTDGPDDAVDDAASASIYATECFITGDAERACWTADLAGAWVFRRAQDELQLDPNDFDWSPDAEPMPFAREIMHPGVQDELRKQLADLEAIQTHELTSEFVLKLKEGVELNPPTT